MLVKLFGIELDIFVIIFLAICIIMLTIYLVRLLMMKKPMMSERVVEREKVIIKEVPVEKQVIVYKEVPMKKEEPKMMEEKPKMEEKPVMKKEDPKIKMMAKPVEEEEEEDGDEPSDTETIIDEVTGIKITIRNNYSLKARMHQAPAESQARYSAIKNALLMFDGVKVRSSWRYDRFTFNGKTILKMAIYTTTTKIFFSEDPKRYLDRAYNLEDVGNKKVHEKTPYLMRITGPQLEDYATRIVKAMLKSAKMIDGYKSNNYMVPFRTKEWLIENKLIKQVRTETQINK